MEPSFNLSEEYDMSTTMVDASLCSESRQQLLELPRLLDRHSSFSDVVAALHDGGSASLEGIWGSSRALAAASLISHAPRLVVVVLPHQDQVEPFCDDLAIFTEAAVERFPAWETKPGEQLVHDSLYGDRLRILKDLASGKTPQAIVTSIQSLLQPTPSRTSLADHSRQLVAGQSIDIAELIEWLVKQGIHRTTAVELPGECALRGGILDIFALDWHVPLRIELFGDEIESMRRFDVSTQRSLESLDAIEVTVLKHTGDDRAHFSQYLPPDAWFLLVEPEDLQSEGLRYLERQEDLNSFHSVGAVWSEAEKFAQVSVAGLLAGGEDTVGRLPIESVERFSGELEKVRDELDRATGDDKVILVCQTEAESQRLHELFASTRTASEGNLRFAIGSLQSGFRLTGDKLVLLSGAEIFRRTEIRRPSQRRLGKAIDSFLALREGDLIVHLAHGIGRYRGLKLLEKEGQEEEHLEIEFHGGTKIYVPTTMIDLVQKYVGGRKTRPSLARIGGQAWTRQKRAVESAVTDLAVELLDLHASRASRPGFALAGDTTWQHEFDASFPYQETADQLTTIDAIKADMQTARPMDRLLCGDVGYGKTELAMRAAFKAVDNGRQVALLVPTTLLAEQHYSTFRERMAEFPIDIARLSRFCTAAEQREIVQRLASGGIDIVIGTHRLASRDVAFQNLGLLIIDEEQRFGVEVKERLKALRSTVDILTLSATPIPRTLNMALVGLRDISNLETPPEDRIAVETRITRWDDELLRHAVLRELSREGQIFFVHNRVFDIDVIAQRLQSIVPEARLCIGHGQMPERELEKVMLDFVEHRFDILLATTIIESGLDIPNANTIFINDADRYGLADLHQLRGRVGRYKHRAYCYLFLDPRKHISPTAARRLRAIEEFSDMGAGFALAMRDLEIRGAGNLLGTQQSGHIATVGYELYCQLLQKAVRELQKLPPELSIHVTVDLPGAAFLPREFVPDMRAKIDLYRRFTRIASDEDLQELRDELVDRFGPLPDPVERIFRLAELRLDAAVWRIEAIYREDGHLVFRYSDRSRAEQLARQSDGELLLVDHQSLYLKVAKGVTDPDTLIEAAKSVLRSS